MSIILVTDSDDYINPTFQCDVEEFCRMLRMPPQVFDDLLKEVRHHITRLNTRYRQSISPEERLSITLKYLATGMYEGDGYMSLYCVGIVSESINVTP